MVEPVVAVIVPASTKPERSAASWTGCRTTHASKSSRSTMAPHRDGYRHIDQRPATSIDRALGVAVDVRHIDRRGIDNIRRRVVNIENMLQAASLGPAMETRPRPRRDGCVVPLLALRA